MHDPRSDIFAVGVILHELLAGGRFREFEEEVRYDGRIPALIDPNTPEQLAGLRVAMLQADVEDRPTAADALRVLEHMPVVRDPAAALGRICQGLRCTSSQEAAPKPGTASQATSACRTEVSSTRLSLAGSLRSPPAAERWTRLAFVLVGAGGATLMFFLAATTASLLR